jgi:colanic acid/amylovoran biosynthesis glycosyltransferase
MKLGYLVSQYPAVNHTYLLREIRGLRSLGFELTVISIAPPDRPPERLTAEERAEAARTQTVKTAPLSRILAAHLATLASRPLAYFRGLAAALRLGGGLRATLFNLLYFLEAVVAGRWLASAGVTHFHVHYSSTVGLLLTRVFPITMSVTFHGRAEFVDPAGFHLRRKVAASRFVCAISFFARSRIMMACEPVLWDRIEIARLGVDTESLAPAEFRPHPDPFEILSVGQLVPIKAHRLLLEALGRVVAEAPHVRLRLAGDGPERRDLEAMAADLGLRRHVIFEGMLNHDQVRELYRRADLFVLPSFEEGLPVVLMEAMSMQVACVATHVAGIPELIRHGLDGLLVAPSDTAGLAQAILELIRDPELRRRLGASARARVLECYRLDRSVATLAEIFRRRLGAQEPRNSR